MSQNHHICKNRPIYITSDVHLNSNNPEGIELFQRFLSKTASEAGQLYILGDLFDAWVGDDLIPRYQNLIDSIKECVVQGIIVNFMHGNRDFLVDHAFIDASGVRMMNESARTWLNDKTALLLHGDTLCQNDPDYLSFRKMVRSYDWKLEFLDKPLEDRLAMVDAIRAAQTTKMEPQAYEQSMITPDIISRLAKKYDVEVIIHGHFHLEATDEYENCSRYGLGEWKDGKGSFLAVYDELFNFETFEG